jgi:hypothetical protein
MRAIHQLQALLLVGAMSLLSGDIKCPFLSFSPKRLGLPNGLNYDYDAATYLQLNSEDSENA